MGTTTSENIISKSPPSRSENIFTDAWNFLLKSPAIETLVKFDSKGKRLEYNQRILQRIGEDVDQNSILNVHQIGIDAPVAYVFNELLNWNGDSTCWPNHVAKVERVNNDIQQIRILPFGWSKYPFGFKKSFLGLHLIPLFYLNSIRIKHVPDPYDFDNARYLLYRSSGGYPIGIYTMYVRSSISEMHENSQSQLAFAVSFNFYGKRNLTNKKMVNRLWESVHNRVTSNVLNRIKQLSEWRFEKIQQSSYQ